MTNFKPITYTLNELPAVANTLLNECDGIRCWAFDAPMGAGKTTLIRTLCEALQVRDTVNSPTFSIINHYLSSSQQTIYHMDWYRLNSEQDAIEAGVEDCLYEHEAWCFVEWPERAMSLLPKPFWHIQISMLDEQTRCLTRTCIH